MKIASARDYEWILLEMYDQTVREKNGGMMRHYLEQNPLPNENFIYQRIGEEGREIIRALRSNAVGKLLRPIAASRFGLD